MLLKREGYLRNFLMDANVIPSAMKFVGKPSDATGPEQVTGPGNQ
jgi:hypothetical protein